MTLKAWRSETAPRGLLGNPLLVDPPANGETTDGHEPKIWVRIHCNPSIYRSYATLRSRPARAMVAPMQSDSFGKIWAGDPDQCPEEQSMRLGFPRRQRYPALPPHQSSEIAGLAQ